MKYFLAAVLLALCATTAHAAPITYKVDHTFGTYTLTGTVKTDGTIDSYLTQANAPNENWNLTLMGDSDPVEILNVFFAGNAIWATDTELRYDFTEGPSVPSTTYLLFGNSSFPAHIWCLQTTDGCSGPQGPYESISIGGSTILLESRTGAGQVTFATVVPVPAAVWLFGSGLIGLIGFARRKR